MPVLQNVLTAAPGVTSRLYSVQVMSQSFIVLYCIVLYCTVLYSVQVMSQTELDSMAAVSQYHRQQEAGMCQVRPNTVHL